MRYKLFPMFPIILFSLILITAQFWNKNGVYMLYLFGKSWRINISARQSGSQRVSIFWALSCSSVPYQSDVCATATESVTLF